MTNSKNKQESTKIAGRHYHTDDYKRQDELSAGLAETHEQVSDAYFEGEIKATIENSEGKNIEIPRKGYE
ncbi:YozQ family protein [Mesobacillus maritimus]|uniref:YozQ family protein n=1 Tax=Mesobacillus maritimus TaxID=1643336 RepID=UPI00203B0A5E|nr:YozQ family protein [Mesobacillus maritimus]MCM3588098.1 YozQ family protein [Mesobacillus maritimus]MCM3668429.1 YozQ family protein [Mesobacillus maritimus]